jgi:peptidoglycan/xylan/chitin deacetylase (PgdA/CDA1 family)
VSRDEKRNTSRAHHWADNFSLWKMDGLTELGRRILPEGYWGETHTPEQDARLVCLTFDDGPCPHTTPWLLEMLDELGAKATFFVIGSQVHRGEKLLEQIHEAGHSIASHSLTHQFMPALSMRALEREIDETNKAIAAVTGQTPLLFRPPYGMMDSRLAACLQERQMRPVYWGVVPEDWFGPGLERVVNRTMSRLRPGTLIVLHEMPRIARQTIGAAKEIIVKGKQTGYDFVSVPELIASRGQALS